MNGKQLGYQRWNASAKAKIVKARYFDRHRVRLAAKAKARLRRTRLKVIRQCAIEGCHRTWVSRHPYQRRKFCLPCARVLMCPSAVRRRVDGRRAA